MAKNQKRTKRTYTSNGERFEVIAGARVTKAVRAINSIGMCTNRKKYDYSTQYVQVMLKELSDAISAVAAKYDAALKGKVAATGKYEFSFKKSAA